MDGGTITPTSGSATTFSNFNMLVGGTGGLDDFVFSDGADLTTNGTIDGNSVAVDYATSNTINYSACTSDVTVNLSTSSAVYITGTASHVDSGISNIQYFVGASGGTNTIQAPNSSSNHWYLIGDDAGEVVTPSNDYRFRFAEFGNWTDGTHDYGVIYMEGTPALPPITISGQVDANGGAHNTLDYSSYYYVASVNLHTGRATGIYSYQENGIIDFQDVAGVGHFQGGDLDDICYLGLDGNTTATGRGGNNTIIAALASTIANITGINAGTMKHIFQDIEYTSTIAEFGKWHGGDGAEIAFFIDTIEYEAANILRGFSDNDTLNGPDLCTYQILGWDSGKIDETNTYFYGLENITGGANGDTFRIHDGMGLHGHLNGGSGYNVLDYSLFSTPVFVNLAAGTATNILGGISNIQAFIRPHSEGKIVSLINSNYLKIDDLIGPTNNHQAFIDLFIEGMILPIKTTWDKFNDVRTLLFKQKIEEVNEELLKRLRQSK